MHASLLSVVALVSLVQAHGVIMAVAGISGNSVGYSVDESIARNCTLISPCQQDTSIIRDVEISANTTGVCGRTELDGNIDISVSVESAIATDNITQVTEGSTLTVTIHQVNQDGKQDIRPHQTLNYSLTFNRGRTIYL
ncbi:hypothetical protein CMQ_3541 [Grosmannia clavigera kw1407]|uniref:Uncharacterized protein n=1 Tax=Grosmannia clavigera (strain kw1407 / UAMH 11150) TaxID=655863 RepID=F0X9R2_GROCL|nr:uncharacterized protein CMQ_3541 [Grosmannia clavigera kw1407]EFX05472.1 hypothetical protein CMQ_3541 [Grosmannia clavigera kw1407]